MIQSPSRSYGLPIVGRVGLAHSLLAWARCELWCKDTGSQMLAPNWNHLRIGPYLRGERDKREYHRLFQFPHYITGPRRLFLLSTLGKIEATEKHINPTFAPSERKILVFRNKVTKNFETHFHEVSGRGSELREALIQMTKSRYLPDPIPDPHIAVHIRLGDFSPPPASGNIIEGATNTRLPVEWYANTLTKLRSALGTELPAIIYSDGGDEELNQILQISKVRRSTSTYAITDLLALTQASALISSGSGFSIWGSFLGNVPRICFPNQRIMRALGEPIGLDKEIELSRSEPVPKPFAKYIINKIGRNSA